MQIFFDFLPILLFFGAFYFGKNNGESALAFLESLGFSNLSAEQTPILLATIVVIVATFLQILYLFLRRKTIPKMLWASFGLLVVFGAMTLIFQNPAFIKAKPSLLYLLFASVFVGGLLFKKMPLKAVLGAQMELPDKVWRQLNVAWILFFVAMAVLNAIVAFFFSTEIWVNFKLFGAMGLTFLFIIAQGFFLMHFLKK